MATEDFTGFTEVDVPADRLTITSTKVAWASADQDEEFYSYYDYGVDHFSGDFEQLLEHYHNSGGSVSTGLAAWALQNIIDDWYYIRYNDDGLAFWPHEEGDAGFKVYLCEAVAGTSYIDVSIDINADQNYYDKFKRIEGSPSILYAYIYDDSGRTNQIDLLTLTLHEDEDFRYGFAGSNYKGGGTGKSYSGYIQNLDLQEVVAAVTRSFGFIIG